MRFYTDDCSFTTRIRWFFVERNDFVPITPFVSSAYDEEPGWDGNPVGELYDNKTPCKGEIPAGALISPSPCGSEDQWAGNITLGDRITGCLACGLRTVAPVNLGGKTSVEVFTCDSVLPPAPGVTIPPPPGPVTLYFQGTAYPMTWNLRTSLPPGGTTWTNGWAVEVPAAVVESFLQCTSGYPYQLGPPYLAFVYDEFNGFYGIDFFAYEPAGLQWISLGGLCSFVNANFFYCYVAATKTAYAKAEFPAGFCQAGLGPEYPTMNWTVVF